MIWPRRFLPFFLIYLFFSIAGFIVLASMLNLLLCPTFLAGQAAALLAGMVLIFIILIAAILVNVWFAGALVHDIRFKRGFERGLKQSKKIYWQLLLLCFVIGLLLGLSMLFRGFGLIVQALVDWIFIFAFPAIVIRKDRFDAALTRSYRIVRKNLVQTLIFWLLTRFVIVVISLVSIVFIALIVSPIFFDIMLSMQSLPKGELSYVQLIKQLVGKAMQNYLIVIAALAVASFFLAITCCFNYLSKTYYFLEISKRRRRSS